MKYLCIFLIFQLSFPCIGQQLYTQSINGEFKRGTRAHLLLSSDDNPPIVIGSGRNKVGPYDFFIGRLDDSGKFSDLDTLERIGIDYIRVSSSYATNNNNQALVVENRDQLIHHINLTTAQIDTSISIPKSDTSVNFYYAGIKNTSYGYVMAGARRSDAHKSQGFITYLDKSLKIIQEDVIVFEPLDEVSISEFLVAPDDNITIIGERREEIGAATKQIELFVHHANLEHAPIPVFKSDLLDTMGMYSQNEAVFLPDGDVLISYELYHDKYVDEFYSSYFGASHVLRMTQAGEVVFDKEIGWGNLSDRNRINRMIPSNDDDSFIFVGQQSPNDYNYLDTLYDNFLNENGDTVINYGVILKIDEDGDEIWARSYRYWGDLVLNTNDFRDIIPLADHTGYHLVGQSVRRLYNGNKTYQWMWNMTVDNYGCLVPGCHLVSSTDDVTNEPLELKIYPNPTTQYVNILNGGRYNYRLLDPSGVVLSTFSSTDRDDTIVLDVGQYASGAYYIQRCDDRGDCTTTKIIKQ